MHIKWAKNMLIHYTTDTDATLGLKLQHREATLGLKLQHREATLGLKLQHDEVTLRLNCNTAATLRLKLQHRGHFRAKTATQRGHYRAKTATHREATLGPIWRRKGKRDSRPQTDNFSKNVPHIT